jgi:hypothetical protein
MRASLNLCQPQFVPCGLVDFLAIMAGEGDYAIGCQTFGILSFWVASSFLGAIVNGAMPMAR